MALTLLPSLQFLPLSPPLFPLSTPLSPLAVTTVSRFYYRLELATAEMPVNSGRACRDGHPPGKKQRWRQRLRHRWRQRWVDSTNGAGGTMILWRCVWVIIGRVTWHGSSASSRLQYVRNAAHLSAINNRQRHTEAIQHLCHTKYSAKCNSSCNFVMFFLIGMHV